MKMCEKCGAVVNPKTDVCDACKGTGVQRAPEPAAPKSKGKKK